MLLTQEQACQGEFSVLLSLLLNLRQHHVTLVLRHPEQQDVTTPRPISTHIHTYPPHIHTYPPNIHAKFSHIHPILSLHVVSTSPIRLLLELHGSLGVGDRAVLLVPVVVLHQGWDTVGVHQDIAPEEGGLDNKWITVEGGLDHKSMGNNKRKEVEEFFTFM